MGISEEITALKNIVRIGTVSSVDSENRTARVKFTDKNNLISGPLKVLRNSPLISTENNEPIYELKDHNHQVMTTPWIPSVGELVLCIYLPIGGSDGFIIGGI